MEIIQSELNKKQQTLDKMLAKQAEYERQYQEYQQEKGKLLTNAALNSVGKGDTEGIATIRQLSNYNNELVREKTKMAE